MKNEALVVFTRRRGPHDQSGDSAIHGRAHGRARAIARIDHSPMYTEPNLVIDVILEAARQTLSR
jgi:hypothetical protein